jgi:hypothetical protein
MERFRVLLREDRRNALGNASGDRGKHEGRWEHVEIGTIQVRVTPVAISKGA